MNEIVFSKPEEDGFRKALDHCKQWCAKHQAEVGIAEMALGVAAISWGVQSGQIHFGTDIVGTKLSDGALGAAAGAGIGAIGASILGSIGVAGAVTFGIPAVILAGGGIAILGAAGYAIGDVTQKFLTPPAGWGDFVSGGSIMTIGIALLIDGARRLATDERVLKIASKFKDGVIQLVPLTTEVVVKSWDELQSVIKNLAEHPDAKDVALGVTTGTTAVAGAAIGGGLAAGSVTVLGSHGLGAVALSLGLVSAPVWPIIAGGAAALAVGLAAWKGVEHFRNKPTGEAGNTPRLLSSPDEN